MYVCGMTVYDYCHLGHARVLVVFDMVRRWLRASGYRVTYVRNITDIDDKIIRRAAENGETIEALTARFIRFMDEDAAALGRRKARPRAARDPVRARRWSSSSNALEAKRLAYRSADGDVNYAVRDFPGYGKLSGQVARRAARGRARRGRRREGRSARLRAVEARQARRAVLAVAVGRGPPRLAHRVLGDVRASCSATHFDIHGGGQDLQFPHHENEIAQSRGRHGQRRS